MVWVALGIIIFLLCWETWAMEVIKWLIPFAVLIAIGIIVAGAIVWLLGYFFNIPRGRAKKKEKPKAEAKIEPKKAGTKLESKPIPKPEKIEAETKKVDETVKESEALLQDIEKFLETPNP